MRILIISNYFPPVNSSASIRALYYANYLRKIGNEVEVITADYPKDFINYDDTLLEKLRDDVIVHRVNMGLFYSKLYPRKVKGKKHTSKSSRMGILKKLAKSIIKKYLLIPDSYVEWKRNSVLKCLKLLEEKSYDIILSMHETPTCHLIAYELKKKYPEIRWVAYWSDPWTFDSSRNKLPRLRKAYERRKEKLILKDADKHLFTTQETINLYEEAYNSIKFDSDIVFRGYEERLYNSIKKSKKPKVLEEYEINIVHVGQIYTEIRDINPFLEALKELKEDNLDLFNKFSFIQLGGIDNIGKVQSLDGLDNVKFIKRVKYEEALSYIVNSQILLLIGNKNSGQIPGKVYDYLGSKNCIFTILGDEDDPLKDFMFNIDRGPVIYNDKDLIKDKLEEIIVSHMNNDMPKRWLKKSEDFQWSSVVNDLYYKLM